MYDKDTSIRWGTVNRRKSHLAYMLPFDHQIDAFNALRGHNKKALSAGTGSGKTVAVAMMSLDTLEQNKACKIIIAVPQLNIGENFRNIRVDMSFAGLGKCDFLPRIVSGKTDSTIQTLRSFIEKKASAVNRVIVCTHQTLAQVWLSYQDCPDQEKLKLFKNLAIWVDEAHHVSGGYDHTGESFLDTLTKEEKNDILGINRLGDIANFYLENNLNIGFVTATMYRSDAFIIPPKYAKDFKWFILPFDEYIGKYCQYINRIGYDFCFFRNDYCEAITELFRQDPYAPTIVYIPMVNTGVSKTTGYTSKEQLKQLKYKEVMEVIQAINPRSKVNRVVKEGAVLYEITVKRKTILVADMVTEKTRPGVESFIRKHVQDKTFAVDVIVALGTFKEGSDYPPLSRAIVVDKRNSVGEMQQIYGRVLRDFKDKNFPRLYHVLPKIVLENYPKDKIREVLNQYFGTLLMSMMMLDMYIPRQIKIKARPVIEKVIGEKFNDKIVIPQEEQQRFNSEVTAIVAERIYSSEEKTPVGQHKVIDEVCESVAHKNKIGTEKSKELRRRLKETYYAATLQGMKSLSFDIVKKIKPLGILTRFSTASLGIKELSEIRRIITGNSREIMEIRKVLDILKSGKAKEYMKDPAFLKAYRILCEESRKAARIHPELKDRAKVAKKLKKGASNAC